MYVLLFIRCKIGLTPPPFLPGGGNCSTKSFLQMFVFSVMLLQTCLPIGNLYQNLEKIGISKITAIKKNIGKSLVDDKVSMYFFMQCKTREARKVEISLKHDFRCYWQSPSLIKYSFSQVTRQFISSRFSIFRQRFKLWDGSKLKTSSFPQEVDLERWVSGRCTDVVKVDPYHLPPLLHHHLQEKSVMWSRVNR